MTQIQIQATAAHELRDSESRAAKELKRQERNSNRRFQSVRCNASEVAALTSWQADAVEKINAAIACNESSCSSLVVLPDALLIF